MFDNVLKVLNTEIDLKAMAEDYEQYKYGFMDTQSLFVLGADLVCLTYSIIAYLVNAQHHLYYAQLKYISLFCISSLLLVFALFGFYGKGLKNNKEKRINYFEKLSLYSSLAYISWGVYTIHLSILQNQVANFMVPLMVYSVLIAIMIYSPRQSGIVLVWWIVGSVWVVTFDAKYNPELKGISEVVVFGLILVLMYSIKYYTGVAYYKTRMNKENMIREYNLRLEKEVEKKTEHIELMNNKLIMAMADMVEGRDWNTGGHIKRTSRAVEILVEELHKSDEIKYPEYFCAALVKAAPMHDLGKITIDDAILRKPGKFTKEEFEIMKSHAANGKDIIHKILEEMDDEYFRMIAENVACYHHERIDGSGYPKGLKGKEIPLEARIMAIADVYDAFVSKRCYKDRFSFEKAASIIEDGMGTQFDRDLCQAFIACKEKLKDYYLSVEH